MTLKPVVLGVLIALSFGASAQSGKPRLSADRAGVSTQNVSVPGDRSPAAVLYSQLDGENGTITYQNFEPAFDSYDSEAADDFVVPAGQTWVIDQVRTVDVLNAGGTAGNATLRVNFHADSATFPGSIVSGCSYTGLVPVAPLGFTINLPTSCTLGSGTYWLAIQVSQNFNPNGQRFWATRSLQSNSRAVWRNPGNGFGLGCTNWSSACFDPATPDLLFELQGSLGSADPVIVPVAVARAQGSANFRSVIANVSNAAGAGSVVVTAAAVSGSGVVISRIQNNNGVISALIRASCSATTSTFTLSASNGTTSNIATLPVTVTPGGNPNWCAWWPS
jgi:hypothetical protein